MRSGACINCRRSQRGAALVVAMLVFSLATVLVVAMQKEFTLFLARGSNLQVAEQSHAYLRGGEELAATVLRRDLLDDKEQNQLRDDPSEIWAQDIAPYALDEGGWLLGGLQDLQGLFNINSLLGGRLEREGQRFTAAQEQFIRLLQALPELEVSEPEAVAITESLIDWLDEDSEPRLQGAEDSYYYDRNPSYRAANREMLSVSELRSVANMTPEIFAALAPLVTVWTEDRRINIHTAPEAVLRTINGGGDLSPLSKTEAETLVELRGEDGFENVQELRDSPVFSGRAVSEDVWTTLTEQSSYFLFSGQVEVADRVTRLYSVLHREESGAVKALVRASGSL